MSSIATVLDFLGATGFVAAIGSVFGLGRLHQKVEQHASHIETINKKVESGSHFAGENKITLARLEERVGSIKDDLGEIKAALRKEPPNV